MTELNTAPLAANLQSKSTSHTLRRALHFGLDEFFTISIIIFASAGLILTQIFSPFPIQAWNLVLIGSIIAAVLVETWLVRLRAKAFGDLAKEKPEAKQSGWLANKWVAAALFLIFVPAFLSIFRSVRMQLPQHGYLHMAYVYQIINGFTPPENVALPGYPGNFYWYFHGLIAAVASITSIAPSLIAAILLLLIMLATIGLVYRILALLIPTENRPVAVTLLVFFALFGMNLLGLAHTFFRAGPANFPLILQTFIQPEALFGDPRLRTLFFYYLSTSGFALGILCFVFILLLVFRLYARQVVGLDFILAVLAVAAALGLHSVSGIFLVVAIPAAIAITYLVSAALQGSLLNMGWHKQQLQNGLDVVMKHKGWSLSFLVVGTILAFFALRFLLGASDSRQGRLSLDLVSLKHAQTVISVSYTLIPFFIVAAVMAVRSKNQSLIFLILLSVIGLALGYATRVANNEYKFTWLASIAMCMVCVVPIWYYLFRPTDHVNKLGRLVAVLMLGLMLLNVFSAGTRLNSPYADPENENFFYDGIRVNSLTAYEGEPSPDFGAFDYASIGKGYPDSDLQYADVFQWARDNTPINAVLIEPLIYMDLSALWVLSERLPYVVDAATFNDTLPDYEKRVAEVKVIYSPEHSPEEKRAALDSIGDSLPGREKLLVYPTNLPSLEDIGGLELLYEGRAANLYRINSNGQADSTD